MAGAGPHFGEASAGGSALGHDLLRLQPRCVSPEPRHQPRRRGRPVSVAALAQTMLALQDAGCHNINFVTPTHHAPQLVQAVDVAARQGLRLPIVWNCGGYESLEVLRLLDGVVDIYMPDLKYADADVGRELSGVGDYPQRALAAVREMHRQVGDRARGASGVARRGLLVRHLVLPGGRAGTETIMGHLAAISPNTYVNVMDQYRPYYRASEFEGMGRRVTEREYRDAVRAALAAGLTRIDALL